MKISVLNLSLAYYSSFLSSSSCLKMPMSVLKRIFESLLSYKMFFFQDVCNLVCKSYLFERKLYILKTTRN